ncbi:MAG: pyridoxamine 5'-phosphate oxidase family protein, partial [Planctomycetia bacterium]
KSSAWSSYPHQASGSGMGKLYASIDESLAAFLSAQKLFFVATAPLSAHGHINLSPKGLDSFRILGPRKVAYLDLTGSGIETHAHTRENGRITLMFCAFEGPPKIVRIHGRARAIEPGMPGFDELAATFPALPGLRSIIIVEAERISDSCGYGVPLYRFEGERSTLIDWAVKKGPQAVRDYQLSKNRLSIDELPGIG